MKKKLFLLLGALGVVSGASAYKHTIINKLGQPATFKVTVLWGGKEATSGPYRNTEIKTIQPGKQYTFAFKGVPCLNYIAVEQPDGSWKKVTEIKDPNISKGEIAAMSFGIASLAIAANLGCRNKTFKVFGTIEKPEFITPDDKRYSQK